MKKLLAFLIAASFAVVSAGSFAAAHTGAQPMKDAKKVDCKDPKNKDDAACKPAAKKDKK